MSGGYQLPPKSILDIVDAPPTPALSLSPRRDKIVFLERRSLPPVADVARPELKLAGLRVDPAYNTRSRMSFYTGMTICELLDDGTLGPKLPVLGLPIQPKINYMSWSPDGAHMAFTVRRDEKEGDTATGLHLWVANAETRQARRLIGPPELTLNLLFHTFSWVDDSNLACLVIPPSRGPQPKNISETFGPIIHSSDAREAVQNEVQNRTFQDLLKDHHDEDLFDYYATSQLVLLSLNGETTLIGPPAIYNSINPSPDGQYLLVSSTHRPYSFSVPSELFPRKTELWKRDGEIVKEMWDRPLAENIPLAFDSVENGRRLISWRADKPSCLFWVETQDGGDTRVDVSPRDIVYIQSAQSVDVEPPTVLFELDLRYSGVVWGDESLALVYESSHRTRRIRTWVFSPGDLEAKPRLLFDRSTEDVYSDPGSPMLRRTSLGTDVAAWTKGAGGKKSLLLMGSGATPHGFIPFLDLFDVETGGRQRIWQSPKEQYFEAVIGLMSNQRDECLTVDNLRILVSKESQAEPPQYYLRTWPDQKVTQLTNFPHPYPHLKGLKKEIIRYKRSDGVQLIATLYFPPEYDPVTEGPLPTILWAYPEEFKSKENAGQMKRSPNNFTGIGLTSPILWIARRFAVLMNPTVPIIGEGDKKPNDRYVEQLVSSAQAAVDEVVKRGVSDPRRIAVGGHSYGAFMTANLLAHAPHLFCCGIARGGAYNRTLTPFGFQEEVRTLWQAPKTYMDMSPFMLADKIKTPILLMHGQEDNIAGAPTIQSERFYNALKGHGATARLVLFPFENHGYQGKESVLHCLWEMDTWLQKHCIDRVDDHPNGQ